MNARFCTSLALASALAAALAGCDQCSEEDAAVSPGTPQISCGAGTVEQAGQCVVSVPAKTVQ